VYYCGDDFGALAGVDGEPVIEMERELVARADLIIAASEVLASRFPPHKTLHVPHGADVALFGKAASPAKDLPTGRPVAGFYGSLSEWVDVELIATAAEALPEWAFVLIGPVRTDVERLKSLGNVTLLGPRNHHELPRYSQHWSVSMMPFRACPQIDACNPLKLREYLAAGRPVVSTEFPAVLRYQNVVNVARTPREFILAIRRAGCGDGDALARQAAVASETWDARAAEIDRALSRL
jgi:glycosyltransferase involved in cell wall biosynthesis